MEFKQYALSHQNTICLELERVALLLDKCMRPERTMKIVHVAGTNGKGSVSAFVCEGLAFGGETVGRFSSPELFSVHDTITVNGAPIKDEELFEIYGILSPLCAEVEAELKKAPSQFEINFVAALLYFKKKNCTYAVLECGMGGAGDATNAIEDSNLCIITGISLDHQTYLGNSVEQIAENKCGIFKNSSVVVSANQEESVEAIIKSCAGERELVFAKPPVIMHTDGFFEVVSFDGKNKIKLSLSGIHQVQNAAVAAEALKKLGFEACVEYALEHAVNPARFQELEPGVFFDGAHNPDGAKNLVESLNRYIDKASRLIFVVGFMADKDYKAALLCLKALKNQSFKIYTVPVCSNPRSESVKELCLACTRLGFDAEPRENISRAIYDAKQNADIVFAFGSLYMYKEYEKL